MPSRSWPIRIETVDHKGATGDPIMQLEIEMSTDPMDPTYTTTNVSGRIEIVRKWTVLTKRANGGEGEVSPVVVNLNVAVAIETDGSGTRIHLPGPLGWVEVVENIDEVFAKARNAFKT